MSQQVITFPSQGSVSRRLVPGLDAMVDYESMTISPCTLDVIGSCLRRLNRYGVHVGPSRRTSGCSVLMHSVYVGELAKRLSRPLMSDIGFPAGPDAIGAAGALHDIGKIFGGSLPVMVPSDVRNGMDAYQEACRSRLLDGLRYPVTLGAEVDGLVALCSLLVLRYELEAIGALEAFHAASWAERVLRLCSGCSMTASMPVERLGTMVREVFSDLAKKGTVIGMDLSKGVSRWKALAAPEIVVFCPSTRRPGLSFDAWDRSEVPAGAWGAADRVVFEEWISSVAPRSPFVVHDLLEARKNGSAARWTIGQPRRQGE